MFEPGMEYTGLFRAESDGYLNKDGVATISVELETI